MMRIYKLILSLSLIWSTYGWGMPESIEITSTTSLAAQPIFGREQYHLGQLSRGSRAEIISVNTNHREGVSLQVRVSEGPERGKLGWVYLPVASNKRSFSVLGKDADKINIAESHQELKSAFNDFRKSVQDSTTPGIFSKSPELVNIKNDSEVWEDFLQGNLKLEGPDEDSNIFTFSQTEHQQGIETVRKYAAPIGPKQVAAIPNAMAVVSQVDLDCEEESPVNAAVGGKLNWLEGCEVLGGSVSSKSRNKLEKCYNSIRSTLSGGKKLKSGDRNKVFPLFYSKLNPVEQEFLASVVTSVGEAGNLAPPPEEMVGILMVLKNRKEYAQEKGFHSANMLDAALQSYQFSMYNKGAHHWADALNNGPNDVRVDNAISAFVKFKNIDLSKNTAYKKVYHYHTNYVSPAWKSAKKIVPLILNGVSLKQANSKGPRHIFYRDIAWSFSHNPWSKK